MIGIYKIISPTSKVYIGQSININKRLVQYQSLKCKKQKKLYSSLIKYGFENHTFEIIEQCTSEDLNKRERYWQEFYDSVEHGLNLIYTKTDEKHQIFSKETRQKMSQAKLGKSIQLKRAKK